MENNNNENNNNKKPKHFLVFKIIGFIGLFVAVIGFILKGKGMTASISFGNSFSSDAQNSFNLAFIGGNMSFFGLAIGLPCLLLGFRSEITKMFVKFAKYIQKDNQDDLTDIANTTGDISSGFVKKTAEAIKTGLKDVIYCKHCGGEIDKDSTFCKHCGKSQN